MPRQAGSCRLSPTLGIARVRIQMQGHRGAHSLRCWVTAVRAARPASLASSARTEAFEASRSPAPACRAKHKTIGRKGSSHVISGAATFWVRSFQSRSAEKVVFAGRAKGSQKRVLGKAELRLPQTQALRRSAKPNTRGRAGTRCYAALAGGARLLSGSAAQRTMRAGCVHRPLPNPSIERTSPGKPGAASHLKR